MCNTSSMEFKKAAEILANREQIAAKKDAERILASEKAARAGIHILDTQHTKDTVYYTGNMHAKVQEALKKAGYYVRVEQDRQTGYDTTYISLYENHPRPHQQFNP